MSRQLFFNVCNWTQLDLNYYFTTDYSYNCGEAAFEDKKYIKMVHDAFTVDEFTVMAELLPSRHEHFNSRTGFNYRLKLYTEDHKESIVFLRSYPSGEFLSYIFDKFAAIGLYVYNTSTLTSI